jgi:hypothetical protein
MPFDEEPASFAPMGNEVDLIPRRSSLGKCYGEILCSQRLTGPVSDETHLGTVLSTSTLSSF